MDDYEARVKNAEVKYGVGITTDISNNGRKKMLIVGKTGTGKSTLCNVIAGHPPDAEIYPVSEGALSCTQSTQFANIFFGKDYEKPIRHRVSEIFDLKTVINFERSKNLRKDIKNSVRYMVLQLLLEFNLL